MPALRAARQRLADAAALVGRHGPLHHVALVEVRAPEDVAGRAYDRRILDEPSGVDAQRAAVYVVGALHNVAQHTVLVGGGRGEVHAAERGKRVDQGDRGRGRRAVGRAVVGAP